MTDHDELLARADNIRDGWIDRFASDNWSHTETDYARKLIADLAAALRAALAAQPDVDDLVASIEAEADIIRENGGVYGSAAVVAILRALVPEEDK